MLTKRQKTLTLVALMRVVNDSHLHGNGMRPTEAQVKKLTAMLEDIRPVAQTLTDKELVDLALECIDVIYAMPVFPDQAVPQ